MKPLHLVLLIGLAGSGGLVLFADKTPNTSIVEPATRLSTRPSISTSTQKTLLGDHEKELHIKALLSRATLIGGERDKKSEPLFTNQSWTPPPPPAQEISPLPPSAPPLPFSYLGKKLEDGRWEIYLERGDRTVIAREQIVIDDMYRVDSIKPPLLSLTYLPLQQVQTLIIGGID
ncbi:hypothetical protein [Collimonas arenae]|uniref:hypothetical protein n=1 Tax=Collimonas arenae TaxID=279058 RepID=UPI0009EE3537|nr:hypothetical protein [Collimonas arenae]